MSDAPPTLPASTSVSPPTRTSSVTQHSTLNTQLSSSFRLGAIILAAGASNRLGQPKQLLLHEGIPLVTRAAQAALAASASPVVVVLGAHIEKIRPALATLPVIIAENTAWSEGMASSIRIGLTALEATTTPTPDAVLIALCDQPHFSANAITRLLAALAQNVSIAATRNADDTGGVPAIFTRVHIPALHALRGSEGARRIIAAHAATTALVDLPELALDIDTPEDLQRLNSR